jgi:hypothetical protein
VRVGDCGHHHGPCSATHLSIHPDPLLLPMTCLSSTSRPAAKKCMPRQRPTAIPTQRGWLCVCVEANANHFCGRRESDPRPHTPLSPHLATRPLGAILKPIPTSAYIPNPFWPRGDGNGREARRAAVPNSPPTT